MARVVVNRDFKAEMGRPQSSREWQRVAGTQGKAAISRHAPVKFGTLAGTIFVRPYYDGRTTSILYGSTRPYAGFQEFGTGLYGPLKKYITPRRAKYLSWIESTPGEPGGPGGNRRFAKKVKGSKPRLYMYKGLSDTFSVKQTRSWAATGGKRGT